MYIFDMDHMPIAYDSPLVASRKIRYNFEWTESYLNSNMYYADSTLYEVSGGVIFGMELSVSGNNVLISSGVAIINDIVQEVSSTTVSVKRNTSGYVLLAFTNNGYKYYCGNVSDIPSGYSYITIGSYTDVDGTITVSEASKDKSTPIVNTSISGSFESTVSAHETKIVEVDHSGTGSFEIPGYITVELEDGFYTGGYSYSGTFISAEYRQEQNTPSTFQVEITNTSEASSIALVSWTRSGIMRVNHIGDST